MTVKNIGVLTSGGDAPGMNAAIRAVVRSAIAQGIAVFGIERGYAGLIDGDIYEMNNKSVGDIIHRGGTILKTSRCLEFQTDEGIAKAVQVANIFKLDAIVVIGGDGSLRGAKRLQDAGVKTIGIPATIDNDLGYTDCSIGLDTAIDNVLSSINKIRDSSSSHERITIVEVMGRKSGDIALYSGLAGGAESIILPEIPYSINDICRRLIDNSNSGKRYSIIVLAEGAQSASELSKEIEANTGMEVKSCVLGYVQRGGNPSATDRILATRLGDEAIRLILRDETGLALGTSHDIVISLPIEEALKIKKVFRKDLYDLAVKLSNKTI